MNAVFSLRSPLRASNETYIDCHSEERSDEESKTSRAYTAYALDSERSEE